MQQGNLPGPVALSLTDGHPLVLQEVTEQKLATEMQKNLIILLLPKSAQLSVFVRRWETSETDFAAIC